MNISSPLAADKSGGPFSTADCFRGRAGRLASWTWDRLVNRTDAWGAYRPLEDIGKTFVRKNGSLRKLGSQTTRKGELTLDLLAQHFVGRSRRHIIGLHTASADNQSKGGALDVDQHGDDPACAEANPLAALHWYDVLAQKGFRPLLTTSDGKGGYHLRVLLAQPIDAGRVRHFLDALTADHHTVGLEKRPEVFPKQADVRRSQKGFGNWLRVPGRHHKRDYWSETWDGSRWLSGSDAIDFMLSLKGDDPRFIPPVALETPRVTPRLAEHWTLTASGSPETAALIPEALAALKPERFTDYDQWLQVGMALHAFDSSISMLSVWDTWSQKSQSKASGGHYERGACAAKWATFDGSGGLTIASLFHWAREDGWQRPAPFVVRDQPAGGNSSPGAPSTFKDMVRGVIDVLAGDPTLAAPLFALLEANGFQKTR
jgi:hypothetical protein